MKIRISKKALIKELNLIDGIVEKRTTMPILNYMLIETKGKNKVEISGTDLEMGIIIEVEAEIEQEGSATVLFSLFNNLIKAMDCEYVDIEEKEESKIELKGGNSFYTLFGLPADNYPNIPLPEGGKEIKIRFNLLKRMIELIKISVSEDQYTGTSGGYFVFNGKKIEAASTDYNRLSYAITETGEKYEESEFLIYKKALEEISKFGKEGDIKIIKGVNNYFFVYKNKKLISRVIEGEFPDFGEYLKKEETKKLSFDRGELLNALRRILNIISSKIKLVTFDIDNDKLVLRYSSVERGEGKEEVKVEYKDEPIVINFNAVHVKDFLENIENDKILMELKDKRSVVKFSPIDKIEEGGNKIDFMYIVVPYE